MQCVSRIPKFWRISQFQFSVRNASQWNCSHLDDRSVLQISGTEAPSFLQGLMTNDINILVDNERKSLYCMFLNTGGRILFDAIISKGSQSDQYLLDLDSKMCNLAKKHLSLYKVRRKIRIDVSKDLSVHAVFKGDQETVSTSEHLTTQSHLIGSTFCDGGSGVEVSSPPLVKPCLAHPDPRLASLGHRIILENSEAPAQFLTDDCKLVDREDFLLHRCKLGVAEGSDDIPLGKCTPLEHNLDYLHGVSFHKGCYLGQELTARTHHTGVIRKRILPLKLAEEINIGNEELAVVNQAGKSVGKVRRVHSDVGLGLMRLKESFSAEKLTVNGTPVTVEKPRWWPSEKENDHVKNNE